ncbi:MAG: GntR family transcriptional regulator [Firmicutes bacterium]|nr:GntR family transcriptional regulator [Bacillota bacterium]
MDKVAKENEKRNAEQIAYCQIKDAIRNKQILPGRKLAEAALGEKLGMSRTPVRAALKQLEFQGYVKIVPHKGAFVIEPTVKEIDNTYEVRVALEQLAVELLIDKLTDKKISELKNCIATEQEAYDSKNYDEYDRINREYHLMIAQMSENDVLYQYIMDTLNKVDGYILLYDRNDPMNSPASFIDHRRLLGYICAKDVESAQKCIAEHIHHAKSRLIFDVNNHSPVKDYLSY